MVTEAQLGAEVLTFWTSSCSRQRGVGAAEQSTASFDCHVMAVGGVAVSAEVGTGSMDLVSLFMHKREASALMGLHLALDRSLHKALLIVATAES